MHHNNSRFLVTVLSKTIWKIIVSKKKIVISLAIIAGLSTPTAFAGEWSIGGSVLSQVTPYKGAKSKDYLLPVPLVNYQSENFYFATLAISRRILFMEFTERSAVCRCSLLPTSI